MQLLVFILLALFAWLFTFIKLKKEENGLTLCLKNLSVVLIFDITILAFAYAGSTLMCENQRCSDSYMTTSILVASIFALVWALMLVFKPSKKRKPL